MPTSPRIALLVTMRSSSFLFFALLLIQCSPPLNGRTDHAARISVTTIACCGQHWMTTNLDVRTYRNGDPIPQVTDPTAWKHLTTGAWCWYNNDSAAYAATYGRLYNWYAVNDPRGIAPKGWHVFTDVEWSALDSCWGGGERAGAHLKEAGTDHWNLPNSGADNSSGFTGLPGGQRSEDGIFTRVGLGAVFWTSVEGSVSEAWCTRLLHNFPVTGIGYTNKAEGYSVRCVKDH